MEEFDPFDVPTVTELLSEIDEWDAKHSQVDQDGDSQMTTQDSDATVQPGSEKKVADWEKTRLKPYVEYFRRFVSNLLADEGKNVKREREDGDAMEF